MEAEQSGFDPLSALLEKEGEDFVRGFESGNYWAVQLCSGSDLVIVRFNALVADQKKRMMARMDSAYPGMVLHYLMEARGGASQRMPQRSDFLFWWAGLDEGEIGALVAPGRAKLVERILSQERRIALFLAQKGYGQKERSQRFARACAFDGWEEFFADWERGELLAQAHLGCAGDAGGGQKRI